MIEFLKRLLCRHEWNWSDGWWNGHGVQVRDGIPNMRVMAMKCTRCGKIELHPFKP